MFLRLVLPASAALLIGAIAPAAAQWRNYEGYENAPPAAYYRGPVQTPVQQDSGYDNEYSQSVPEGRRGPFASPYYGSYGGTAPAPDNFQYPGDGADMRGGARPSETELNAASQQRTGTVVENPTRQAPGTIVVDTRSKHLYLVLNDGSAMQYGIGVGREGFAWKGEARVQRKAEWPAWYPPKEMIKRRPDLPEHMEGGMENPLGARALYLYQGNKDTLFRIHGTNEPDTIGKAVSSGCIRMMNADVVDLYKRVPVGTHVVVI
jgi:lipoprotein-anchoring transpeptidase ErfK/SrfK